MPELCIATKEHSTPLDTLALQSKDPALYPPHAIDWWKDSYNGAREEQFEQDLVIEAIEQERIVGFYALRYATSGIILSHLFVSKDVQRQGIGSVLLKEALLHGHRLGADTMELTSDPLARDFYTKAGAEVIRVFDEASSYPTYAMKINCQ